MSRSIYPVLVGAGQLTDRPDTLANALSPLAMMYDTACASAQDAGLTPQSLQQIDVLAMVNSVGPTLVDNPPAALASRIGAQHAKQFLTTTGGNTPQMLVNHFANEIAAERASMVLLTGAEALDSLAKAAKLEQTLPWEDENTATAPNLFDVQRPGSNPTELGHGMMAPIVTYPLFENALRRHYGRSRDDHQRALGELFAPFTNVACTNPNAWFPIQRTAQEIATPSAINRYIGYPYTKFLNSVMQVNQSASVLLMSDVKARALGIDESKWVYLHGCADVNDIWHVSERINFHSSPALELGLASAFGMAGTSAVEIDHFDIYSCFPAVVQMTRDAMGMSADDPRPLTVTGGLPYFGGAGNNYSMHAIASMMDRLREHPGDRGLVTANGWYVTKHALGVYSTQRPKAAFNYSDPGALSRQVEALDHPRMDPQPTGLGTLDTYTVMFDRNGEAEHGLVLGTLHNGARFVAYTRQDSQLLKQMVNEEMIDRTGTVTCGQSTNLFEFN